MVTPPATHRDYSRAETLSDGVVHVAGLAFLLGAVPVLIVLAALLRGDAGAIAGVSIYAATLALMLLASALYNMIHHPDWTWLLRRMDHAAIYLKIAGTYTGFMALSGHGLGLVAGLWGAALAGVGLKIFSAERFRWIGLALYIGMGWAGLIAGGALFGAMPLAVVILIFVGGGLYTAGIGFYLWKSLPFHNTIWHSFVLAASLVFYAAVVVAIVLQGQ